MVPIWYPKDRARRPQAVELVERPWRPTSRGPPGSGWDGAACRARGTSSELRAHLRISRAASVSWICQPCSWCRPAAGAPLWLCLWLWLSAVVRPHRDLRGLRTSVLDPHKLTICGMLVRKMMEICGMLVRKMMNIKFLHALKSVTMLI